ncbi:uncharacterized protein LOC103280382 [Anolis carolinensis]|uniref:uncharacterized protein LOC103280382 n=1 Tax=Anolis carolinensis TaxID=28377 RepID=UPI0004627622|nr:PREDICTED: uncharacterized protein LOC103280382 [Anolis carolinensis]|eukprot:XP_008117421.1 PREDICTED: uncharacterized protein LOC103280382 [Anolis carolinensis]
MGKTLWWSLLLIFAPAGQLGEAEIAGDICRFWSYGAGASSATVFTFQCPDQNDEADARFCCGTCAAPYCCSSKEFRLDQKQCVGSEQRKVATRSLVGNQGLRKAQGERGAQARGVVGVTQANQIGQTTQVEETTQTGWTTQANSTMDLVLTTPSMEEDLPEWMKMLSILLGIAVAIAFIWLTCRLCAACRDNPCLVLLVQNMLEQDSRPPSPTPSDDRAPPSPPHPSPRISTRPPPRIRNRPLPRVINMPPLPFDDPPPYREDNPPPYSLDDPFSLLARSSSETVVHLTCMNPGYQEDEEVPEMSPLVLLGDGHNVSQPAMDAEQALPLPDPSIEGQVLTLADPSSEGRPSSLPEVVGEGQAWLQMEAAGEGEAMSLPEDADGAQASSLTEEREAYAMLEFFVKRGIESPLGPISEEEEEDDNDEDDNDGTDM